VICDEVQRFAAKTLFEVVDPWPAKWRIGISADESRKDGKEFLVYDLFGQVAAEIGQDELIEAGYVHDVQVCIIPTSFEADWYKDTMKQANNAWGKRSAFDRLLGQMGEDESRNEQVASIVAKEVGDGHQAIVLSHRREHCVTLDHLIAATKGIKTGLLIGGADYAASFKEARKGLLSGEFRAGVGTVQAIGQGLDLPSVSVAVVATPLATNRQLFGQVRGRVCRTSQGKEGARLYYLWDRKVYGLKAVKNLVAWNKNVVIFVRGEWIKGRDFLKE
jgi:superfamily II DNA or RNA helicase